MKYKREFNSQNLRQVFWLKIENIFDFYASEVHT